MLEIILMHVHLRFKCKTSSVAAKDKLSSMAVHGPKISHYLQSYGHGVYCFRYEDHLL